MRGATFLLSICFVGLAGCTDASQFQAPIATFASASSSAATSFSALDAASAARLSALREAEAVPLGSVTHPATDCTTTGTRCVLTFQKAGAGGTVITYQLTYNSLMPKSVAFANGLKDYAAALSAIESADASAAVQTAFGSAMGAIAAVAGAVNVPAGAVATAISKPLSSVVGFGFLQYQNSIKLEALQKATSAAEPIIEAAVPILDKELSLANDGLLASLEDDLNSKDTAFLTNHTATNLTAEVAAANALDAALQAKSSHIFDAVKDAHAELAAAVQKPKENTTQLAAAVTAFAQQAQNIQQIVKATTPAKN